MRQGKRKEARNGQLIYGIHAVNEALDSGKDIQKLIIQSGNKSEQISQIIQKCRSLDIPVQLVPKEKFFFLQDKNHQGIAGFLSNISYHRIENILPAIFEEGKTPFLIILDRITDVRNFGAIARSALNGGVDAIILPLTDTAPVNEDAIKTSAGSLMKIPICRERNLKTTLEFLNQSGVKTIACSEKAAKNIFDVTLDEPVAFIMGSEETGVSKDLLKKCSELVKIPMEKGVASLNVSVATGIAVYETVRQRLKS